MRKADKEGIADALYSQVGIEDMSDTVVAVDSQVGNADMCGTVVALKFQEEIWWPHHNRWTCYGGWSQVTAP